MKLLKNIVDYNELLPSPKIQDRFYRTNLNNDFNPSTILAQSFGAGNDKESYNYVLAQATKDARERFGKDLETIVQKEIGDCLKDLGEKDFYIVGERKNKEYISTKIVLEESKKIIDDKKKNPKEILYVSHPAQVYRVMEMGKKLGLEGFPFIRLTVDWPKKDPQKWVRFPYIWVPREILVRIYYKIKGIVD